MPEVSNADRKPLQPTQAFQKNTLRRHESRSTHRLCEYSQSRFTILNAMSSYGGPAEKCRSTVSSFPGSFTILNVGALRLSMRSG